MAEFFVWQRAAAMRNRIQDSAYHARQRLDNAVHTFQNRYTTVLATVQGNVRKVISTISPASKAPSRTTTLDYAHQNENEDELQDELEDDLLFLYKKTSFIWVAGELLEAVVRLYLP
jgi:hypothetical protein